VPTIGFLKIYRILERSAPSGRPCDMMLGSIAENIRRSYRSVAATDEEIFRIKFIAAELISVQHCQFKDCRHNNPQV
jgi:hypothetical protein